MKRLSLACLGLAALIAAPALNAAEPPGPRAFPGTGKAGAFAGATGELPAWNSGGSARAASSALAGLRADGETVRGGAEAAIYRKIAPSVVLVVSDKGLGSGSIISADGQILTNYHVVAGFQRVSVVLKPAKEGEKIAPSQAIIADVIKADPVSDLALLKMQSPPPADRTPIAFGDFDKVAVGDDVSAIGHPEGEIWTYTKGYVSQIRRDYKWKTEDGEHHADVIQTQTPINPGNSGGPLLNSKGALIGVNAFIATEGQNLSYAIGVDVVQDFLKTPAKVAVADLVGAEERKCKPQILFEGRTDKNDAMIRRYDMNCDGQADLAFVLPDDTSQPMTAWFDTTGSGRPDGEVLSFHRDGHWDISYWDTKHTGKWDTIGYHPDGKLVPTSYGPYIPKQTQAGSETGK